MLNHPNYKKLSRKNSLGFTLIEIMVAMVIGLFLMGGVIQLFSAMNTSSNLQQQMGYLQENGRLGIELLSKEIRSADYWGCVEAAKTGSVIDPAGDGYSEALHGGPQTTASIGGTDNAGLNGSDTIFLRGASDSLDVRIVSHNINAATIGVAGEDVDQISKGQVVLLSNCQYADLFQVTNEPTNQNNQVNHNTGAVVSPGNKTGYNHGTGNCTNCLQSSYANTGASILIPYSKSFSILAGASGEPSLFVTNSTDCPAGCELIQGVENMQILYGEDIDADKSVDRYVASSAVTNMDDVVAVNISLLIRTETKVASSSQTMNYNGESITYSDDLLRKVYSATVTIRNRM